MNEVVERVEIHGVGLIIVFKTIIKEEFEIGVGCQGMVEMEFGKIWVIYEAIP